MVAFNNRRPNIEQLESFNMMLPHFFFFGMLPLHVHGLPYHEFGLSNLVTCVSRSRESTVLSDNVQRSGVRDLTWSGPLGQKVPATGFESWITKPWALCVQTQGLTKHILGLRIYVIPHESLPQFLELIRYRYYYTSDDLICEFTINSTCSPFQKLELKSKNEGGSGFRFSSYQLQ